MIRRLIFTLFAVFIFVSLSAQNEVENQEEVQVKEEVEVQVQEELPLKTEIVVKKQEQMKSNADIVAAFLDTLVSLRESYLDYSLMWEDLSVPVPRMVRLHPDYYKLFVPPTFYLKPIQQVVELDWKPGDRLYQTACDTLYKVWNDTLQTKTYELPDLERSAKVDRRINRMLMNFYLEHPDKVIGNELYFADMKSLDDIQLQKVAREEKMKKYMEVTDPRKTNEEVDLVIMKPNFWKYSGKGMIQFTQNNISDNWYNGGENTNALYSEIKLTANYDNKQGIEFENSLEIKLGFITAPSDTVHKYKTTTDMFRLNSKLGIRAVKNLYYTLAAELKTQFFPNYQKNSDNMVSSFLTPAQLKVEMGLDYKFSRKKLSLSVFGAPLTYKHVYLRTDNIVNPSSFEVKAGRRKADIFGSSLTSKVDWKIRSNIIWNSKLEYFTTYEKVIMSWENTFEFKLNRYLSTTLFLHSRFDDGVRLTEENDTYVQFKEMLTFGLSYSW